MRSTCAIVLAAILLAAPAAAPADAQEAALRVHLPRAISVQTDALALGMVAVLRADDASLVARTAAIPLGRAPWSREELVIDRPTILGRLASHGLKADRVAFTGADKVVVTRGETVVPTGQIVKAAEAFLEKARPSPGGCRWRLVAPPSDLYVPAGCPVALEAHLVPHALRGRAQVEVAAMAEGRKLAATPVLFRPAYVRRQVQAVQDIPEGGVITHENAQVRTILADGPEPADWTPPYGQLAARPIAAGTVILPGLVRPARPELLVRRNEGVVMRIVGDGFQITALGQALEDGRQGDLIRVRNVDSKRIIVAKVVFDGTVTPVLTSEP
jgi:flagella basal body P-ring formation protein FlgA